MFSKKNTTNLLVIALELLRNADGLVAGCDRAGPGRLVLLKYGSFFRLTF